MKTSLRNAIATVVIVALLVPVHVALAQAPNGNGAEPLVVSGLDEQGRIRLTPGKSIVLTTRRPQKTVSIGDPAIIDVTGISPTRVLATAKKTGSTQIIVWDEQDASQSIDVIVAPDVAGLREQLDRLFPGHKIETSTSENTVILSGSVPSLASAEQAQLLAAPYGQNVVNLLEVVGGQQVLLQVRIAEVSRSATRQLGINLGFTDGSSFAGSNIGQISPFAIRDIDTGSAATSDIAFTGPTESVTLFGRAVMGESALGYMIAALRDNNLLRILAEPNLVAISGQEASFLAGGEFPIPVPQGGTLGNTITIEFREFGVRLTFVPVVLGDGRIRLKLAPEVSDLDFTTAVRFGGFVVPGLTQRKVSTTVEMFDGQSLAIAGLLNQNVTSSKSVTPLLGDVPVLGALFRSVRYQRKETELVILVTPRIVTAMSADQVPSLPGENWRHPDELGQFLFQDIGGVEEGGATTQPSGDRRRTPRAFYGSVGFAPAAEPAADDQ